jgi:hypothetical protein
MVILLWCLYIGFYIVFFFYIEEPELWCDCFYLNTNFNCGPYLLRSKLIKLSKCIGPGPVVLVISSVSKVEY